MAFSEGPKVCAKLRVADIDQTPACRQHTTLDFPNRVYTRVFLFTEEEKKTPTPPTDRLTD